MSKNPEIIVTIRSYRSDIDSEAMPDEFLCIHIVARVPSLYWLYSVLDEV